MYLALYRAYRPETFGEILGQEHIVKILKNQLRNDTVSHAYLFCGSRGTGKTTTARILAKGINCVSGGERPCGVCEVCKAIKDGVFIDVIEIDAASNNGVDNIRELRESVKYPPAAGRKKVYIIDEVHMLSTGAFNALLKTLEEPPEYMMFVLATTEPQKLPATILSRCLRLDFRRVPESLIVEGMAKICAEKGIGISESALRLIAVNADGSVRDGLSILDQCIAPGDSKVTREDVLALIGAAGEEVFLEMADRIAQGATGEALMILDRALSDGRDARQFLKDMLAHYRNLMIVKFLKKAEDILNLSSENTERLKAQSDGIPLTDINRAIVEISKASAEAKWSTQPRVLAELCIVMLSEGDDAYGSLPRIAGKEGKAEAPVIKASRVAGKVETPVSEAAKRAATGGREENNGNISALETRSVVQETVTEGQRVAQKTETETQSVTQETEAETQSVAQENEAEGRSVAQETEIETQNGTQKTETDEKASRVGHSESGEKTTGSDRPEADKEPGYSGRPESGKKTSDSGYYENDKKTGHAAIWDSLFEGEDALKGSFTMIRGGTEIKSASGDEYTVAVKSDFIRDFIEKNKRAIEELLEKRSGSRCSVKIMSGDMKGGGEKPIEAVAAELGAALGIDVEIEE